jgi:hypothetical protein
MCSAIQACSSSDDNGATQDAFGNASGSGGGSGLGDGGADRPGRGHGSAGGLTPETACGIGNAMAQLAPVNMLLMFDRSGSMEDDDKWTNASAALTAFIADPAAADLGVALRFFPHDEPASGCNNDDCDADACSNPLVDLARLSVEQAPADAHEDALLRAIRDSAPGGEGQGTPMYAALDGALRWATDFDASHPDDKTVVVFVTDGKPNGCDEDIDHISGLAADALAQSELLTYAIGLQGSSEAQMDQLASAGGTQQGIFIGGRASAEAELLDALTGIRGENLACDFPFPAPADPSEPIDPSHVSVNFYYPDARPPLILAAVERERACGDATGWYYDDPQDPTRIFLCPHACESVRSVANAGLQILIGCAEGGGTPLNCADNPDDPACVVD